MGVVHHAAYLVYFEEGRSHYMRSLGSNYADIEAAGFRLPVTEVNARYSSGARFGDVISLRTWLEESRSRQLTFSYELFCGDDPRRIVRGTTRHIWTDIAGNVTRAPDIWNRLLNNTPGKSD
jgi:acyl-CoA thioester hydrolase